MRAILLVLMLLGLAPAANPLEVPLDSATGAFVTGKVIPLFKEHCWECHGGGK